MSVLILVSSLHGYSKKIIFGAYSLKENANKQVKNMPGILKNYKQLLKLTKEARAKIYVRKVGKYNLIVAEVFEDEETVLKALKIIKKSYIHAYANYADSVKEPDTKKLQKEIKISVIKEVKKQKVNSTIALKEVSKII